MRDPNILKVEEQIRDVIAEESTARDCLQEARQTVINTEAAVHRLEARRLRLIDKLAELVMLQTLTNAVEEATGRKKPVVGSS